MKNTDKVTLTVGQIKRLIKESKPKNKNSFSKRITESKNEYDFNAAYRFLMQNYSNHKELYKAFSKTWDELGSTGDLQSAIDNACDDVSEEIYDKVCDYFNESYPSAMDYVYHPAKGWDGDTDALGALFQFALAVLE